MSFALLVVHQCRPSIVKHDLDSARVISNDSFPPMEQLLRLFQRLEDESTSRFSFVSVYSEYRTIQMTYTCCQKTFHFRLFFIYTFFQVWLFSFEKCVLISMYSWVSSSINTNQTLGKNNEKKLCNIFSAEIIYSVRQIPQFLRTMEGKEWFQLTYALSLSSKHDTICWRHGEKLMDVKNKQ